MPVPEPLRPSEIHVEHGRPVERFAARTAGMTASEIRALFAVASRPEVVSLAGGMPNLAALPLDTLADEVAELVSRDGQVALQYGSAQGVPALREQICEVMALEGIHADPNDVVVTVGSQMALDLITRIFCDPGDVVLAEGPSYVGALGSFAAYQARVVHVAMDAHGLVPELLREALRTLAAAGGAPKYLYTIPNFHNPAGVTLAVERRREVLESAPGTASPCSKTTRTACSGSPGSLYRAAVDGPGGCSTSARSPRRSPRASGSAGRSLRTRSATSWCWPPSRRHCARRPSPSWPSSRYLTAHDWRGPDQDLHRGLPRAPRRHARGPGDVPARRFHVDTSRTAASTSG